MHPNWYGLEGGNKVRSTATSTEEVFFRSVVFPFGFHLLKQTARQRPQSINSGGAMLFQLTVLDRSPSVVLLPHGIRRNISCCCAFISFLFFQAAWSISIELLSTPGAAESASPLQYFSANTLYTKVRKHWHQLEAEHRDQLGAVLLQVRLWAPSANHVFGGAPKCGAS